MAETVRAPARTAHVQRGHAVRAQTGACSSAGPSSAACTLFTAGFAGRAERRASGSAPQSASASSASRRGSSHACWRLAVGQHHRHAVVDPGRDPVGRGVAGQQGDAVDPLPVDLRGRPHGGERERDAAVHLEEERLARLAALLGLEPLEPAVGELQRAPFAPRDQPAVGGPAGDRLHARVDHQRPALDLRRPGGHEPPAHQLGVLLAALGRDDREHLFGGSDVVAAGPRRAGDRHAETIVELLGACGVGVAAAHTPEHMRRGRMSDCGRAHARVASSGTVNRARESECPREGTRRARPPRLRLLLVAVLAAGSLAAVGSAPASAAGSFVIGNQNAAVGTSVTFWGAKWWKLNSLSGGTAPAAFKGYENEPSGTPKCRTPWSTDPGQQLRPARRPAPRADRSDRLKRSLEVRPRDIGQRRRGRARGDRTGLRLEPGARRDGHGRRGRVLRRKGNRRRRKRRRRRRCVHLAAAGCEASVRGPAGSRTDPSRASSR